jgi:mannosyltransferase OCH1-like enzyme
MPEKFKQYIQTWKDNHPTWKFMIWTPVNMPKLINQKEYDREKTYAGKSDIARYEVLNKIGGIYVDVDIENYKPIDRILKGIEFFVTYERDGYVVPTIMGCTPGHPLIKKIIDGLPENQKMHVGSKDISSKSGPKYISKILDYNDERLTIFPRFYFQPTLEFEKDNMVRKYPASYGIHHFNGRQKGGWYYNLLHDK